MKPRYVPARFFKKHYRKWGRKPQDEMKGVGFIGKTNSDSLKVMLDSTDYKVSNRRIVKR